MNIKIDNETIVLEIPIEELKNSQYERDDLPFEITDNERMKQWLLSNWFDVKEFFDEDNEKSLWQYFLDDLFSYAYEHAESWLQGYIRKE